MLYLLAHSLAVKFAACLRGSDPARLTHRVEAVALVARRMLCLTRRVSHQHPGLRRPATHLRGCPPTGCESATLDARASSRWRNLRRILLANGVLGVVVLLLMMVAGLCQVGGLEVRDRDRGILYCVVTARVGRVGPVDDACGWG